MRMIEGYVTINELAKKWNVSNRSIQIMCAEGKLEGATKFGKSWAIPCQAERPKDGRVTTGQYRNWRAKRKHIRESAKQA